MDSIEIGIKIIKRKSIDVGSCTFCSDVRKNVNVVTSETSNVEIRFCDKCLNELKKQK